MITAEHHLSDAQKAFGMFAKCCLGVAAVHAQAD